MKVRIGGLIVVAVATLRLLGGCSSSSSPPRNDAGTGGVTGGAPGSGGAAGAGIGGAGMGGHGTGGEFGIGGHGTGGADDADAGGNDGGQDATSQADGSTDAPAPTLTQIWTTILSDQTLDTSPACNGCHDGSPGIPDYTSPATTYATWVGVASISCPPGIRVTAGNAATSILINKLSAKPNLGLGVTVCGGDPMPLGADRTITLDQLHMIEDWINAGAQNN